MLTPRSTPDCLSRVTGGVVTRPARVLGAFARVTLEAAAAGTNFCTGRARSGRGAAALYFSAEVLIVTSESSGTNLTKIVS